jgi:hypothetical protein
MGEITKAHNFIDMTGQRFGRLVVVSRAESRNKRAMWNCVCDCGNKVVVAGKDMRDGKTKSCGCYHKEHYSTPPRMTGSKNPSYKHGKSGSKLFGVWASIVQRCTNKNNKAFHMYGARGITVCKEWETDFQAFHDWAIANGYASGLSIDRINNNDGYSPDNCRWVCSLTQNNNKRSNILISRNGETHTLSEWARIKNLPYKAVLARYYRHGDTDNLFKELKK